MLSKYSGKMSPDKTKNLWMPVSYAVNVGTSATTWF